MIKQKKNWNDGQTAIPVYRIKRVVVTPNRGNSSAGVQMPQNYALLVSGMVNNDSRPSTTSSLTT